MVTFSRISSRRRWRAALTGSLPLSRAKASLGWSSVSSSTSSSSMSQPVASGRTTGWATSLANDSTLTKWLTGVLFKTNSYYKIAAIPLTQCRVIIFLALVWNNSFVENFRSKSSVRYSHLNCSCVATFGNQGDRLLAANVVILNVVLPPTTTKV